MTCPTCAEKSPTTLTPSNREYILYGLTESLCPVCLSRISAKIVIKAKRVYLLKTCPTHGEMLDLLEEDAEYYLNRVHFDKPGTMCKTQTQKNKGCPFDCGLCPEHDQHTCNALIEITNHCNLQCPVCYANGQTGGQFFLDLAKIEEMLDFFQDTEFGGAEILQISGGEPTTHPDIIKIIELARQKKIKYVMLNTNGVRLAEDRNFVKELSQFVGGFEIYLQFDGFNKDTHRYFCGRDVTDIKRKAIDNLAEYHLPITLVSRIAKGVNEGEIGKIVEFGMETAYIRGVNFQPVTFFGRGPASAGAERITLTGVLQAIEQQTRQAIKLADFVPLPCNVDRVAITYLYLKDGKWVPITRQANIRDYLSFIANTFAFKAEFIAAETARGLLRGEICRCVNFFKDFKAMVPFKFYIKSSQERMAFVNDNSFRISVVSFLDAYNFEAKAMKKECVHIITPDLKKIPFSAYNLLYRPGL